jgi:hypothetical protein
MRATETLIIAEDKKFHYLALKVARWKRSLHKIVLTILLVTFFDNRTSVHNQKYNIKVQPFSVSQSFQKRESTMK